MNWKTICDTCIRNRRCSETDKARGMACKDYKKGVRKSDRAGQRKHNRNR